MQLSDSQLMEAMGVARLLFSFKVGDEDAFQPVCVLENKAMPIAFKEQKQKFITDYFRKKKISKDFKQPDLIETTTDKPAVDLIDGPLRKHFLHLLRGSTTPDS